MIKQQAVTVRGIQLLDKIAIEKFGVPSIVLMENAGRAVCNEIVQELKRSSKRCVFIFCGLGNNAGDGFVVARHLINQGILPKILLIGDPERLKEDAAINCQILKKLGYPIRQIDGINEALLKEIRKSDILVDAIFGVGLNRRISDPFKRVIETLNSQKRKIISVDIPSGLDGTTGKIYGVCIKAYKTVTFSFVKKGFFKKDGPQYVGKVVVVDIGIPKKLFKLCAR